MHTLYPTLVRTVTLTRTLWSCRTPTWRPARSGAETVNIEADLLLIMESAGVFYLVTMRLLLLYYYCWLVRVSIVVERGGSEIFGAVCLGTIMISRPNLGCSNWLGFVYTECFHGVILQHHITKQHLDYVHDVKAWCLYPLSCLKFNDTLEICIF